MAPAVTHKWIEHLEGPLYKQNYPAQATMDEFKVFLRCVEQLAQSMQEPYAFVVDLGGLLHATAEQRALCAETDRRMQEHDRKYCAGVAYVLSGALARGVLTAIYWVTPPVYPYKIFSTCGAAEQWARQQLVARGVALSTP